MADDTQNLQVVLSVQDAGAGSVLERVKAQIASINEELATTSTAGAAAGQSVAGGMQILADKVTVVRSGLAGVSASANETRGALEPG
jgi:hypothetical protein